MTILILCYLMFGWWLWFENVKWNIKYFKLSDDWRWDIVRFMCELFLFVIVGPFIIMVFCYDQFRYRRNSIDQAKQ